MFIINILITGIIATFIFDIFQISLSYAYSINKSRWNLIGRYFVGLFYGKYIQEDLENENEINYELFIGYVIHYIIGIVFAFFYITLNLLLFEQPSIILALIVGFLTVLGGWCILMPFAFNIGYFAMKQDNQKKLLVQNLIAHFIFGIGLYFGYLITI